jgi:ubiquinone/menaquinone biosynthesis C-methylase UbiE
LKNKYASLKGSGIVMSKTNKYNSWQIESIKKSIKGRVLEIGTGIGNITELIAPHADNLVSIEISKEPYDFAKKKLSHFKNLTLINADFMTVDLSIYGKFDLIICTNVLEHIEFDELALRKMRLLLKENGKSDGLLFLLVPAHKQLFGTCDVEVGHFRRYNKKVLSDKIKVAGFNLKQIKYFNSIGAIGWWINFCLLKRHGANEEDSSFQVKIFELFILPWLRIVERIKEPPFGISLVATMNSAPNEN